MDYQAQRTNEYHLCRLIRQSYYAATTYTDFLIGEILILAAALFPDTVVALLGDHGQLIRFNHTLRLVLSQSHTRG